MKFLPFILIVLGLFVSASNAQQINDNFEESFSKPAEFSADSISYDKDNSLMIAIGNVSVEQSGRVLMADKVTYDKNKNTVFAESNISLVEKNGNVLFADKIELSGDLKTGVINRLLIEFKDKSRMTSDVARKKNDNIMTMENIKYSPCFVCKKSNSEPLWQVRSNHAKIDKKAQRVSYKHAFFDIKGIPVLYTPYLSHPTPGADRKSGFLIPKYSTDKIFGTTVEVPYYYNIATNKDLVIAPIFTTKEGTILTAQYRHLIESGKFYLEGSITNPDKVDINGNKLPGDEVRGHIEGHGDFNLNETWSWGFVGKRSTDDTYLRKYKFGEEDVLTSKAYTAAIYGRNFFTAEAISFQGLKINDDPGQTPLILPNANIHYETKPKNDGSKWTLDGNVLMLYRDEGVSSNRVSLTGGWEIPYISKSGHIFEFKTSLRGDGYFVDDVPEDPSDINSRRLNGFTSRLVPQVEAKWKFPVARGDLYLEPTAQFVFSPYGGNPNKIHNEDSQDIEFSDENLFDSNHFTGFDRLENGPRVNYGVRGGLFDTLGGDFNFLFGQNYRTRRDKNFSISSGLDSHFSDYIGMIGYDSQGVFDLTYRFRVDKDSFSFNRNSISAGIDISPVKFDLDYLSVDESFDANDIVTDENRELVIANTTIDITDRWQISGGANRNLESGDWVSTKANVLYKGDCVGVSLEWLREFTRDRDIRPNTTLSVQISLKNLGY